MTAALLDADPPADSTDPGSDKRPDDSAAPAGNRAADSAASAGPGANWTPDNEADAGVDPGQDGVSPDDLDGRRAEGAERGEGSG